MSAAFAAMDNDAAKTTATASTFDHIRCTSSYNTRRCNSSSSGDSGFSTSDNSSSDGGSSTLSFSSSSTSTSTTTNSNTNSGSSVLRVLWDTIALGLATRPCDAVADASAWSCALVGQCLSRARRAQFDEEHQRSLLSCHSTEENGGGESIGGLTRSDGCGRGQRGFGGRGGAGDWCGVGCQGGLDASEYGGGYDFADDATLELRRRVMKDEATPRYLPTFARDLGPQHPIHHHQHQLVTPLTSRKPASRWEKRKAAALALKLQVGLDRSDDSTAHDIGNSGADTVHAQTSYGSTSTNDGMSTRTSGAARDAASGCCDLDTNCRTSKSEFATLLVETERALDDILLENDNASSPLISLSSLAASSTSNDTIRSSSSNFNNNSEASSMQTSSAVTSTVSNDTANRGIGIQELAPPDDIRRLSVDELLARRPLSLPSTARSVSLSRDGGGASSNHSSWHGSKVNDCGDDNGCVDRVNEERDRKNGDRNDPARPVPPSTGELHQWLAAMDPPRAAEYLVYARLFEAQGFHALADLAELAGDEVEQAMSEVGIVKFAHRARIRKAIQRLLSGGGYSEGDGDSGGSGGSVKSESESAIEDGGGGAVALRHTRAA